MLGSIPKGAGPIIQWWSGYRVLFLGVSIIEG